MGEEVAGDLVHELTEAGRTIAVAESLTGGLVAAAITSVPGASVVFRGSVTAYATEIKASLLGVDEALLAAEGAVHPEVASQMARGIRRLLGADIGLATTGVAGPTEQDGKPVGLVYVACDRPRGGPAVDPRTWGIGDQVSGFMQRGSGDREDLVLECRFTGDRQAIRDQSVQAALALAR